jgi:hypothetical protein
MPRTRRAANSSSVAERRKQPRNSGPQLILRFEGQKYKTLDWSIGSFRIKDFHRPLRSGERLQGSIYSWFGMRHEDFEANVVRVEPSGEIGCMFLNLPRTVARMVL